MAQRQDVQRWEEEMHMAQVRAVNVSVIVSVLGTS
jgi:hypothetical protein